MNCELYKEIGYIYDDLKKSNISESIITNETLENIIRFKLDNPTNEEVNAVLSALTSDLKRAQLNNEIINNSVTNLFVKVVDGSEIFDYVQYSKFIKESRQKVLDSLIFYKVFKKTYAVVDETSLNQSIKKIETASRKRLSLEKRDVDSMIENYRSESNSEQNEELFFDAVFVKHINEIYSKLSNNAVSYDYYESKFKLQDKSHHSKGWGDQSDVRSAYQDSSGTLKLLVESTKALIENDSGWVSTDFYLNTTMFFKAFNDLREALRIDEYDTYLDIEKNPYKILDVLDRIFTGTDFNAPIPPMTINILKSIYERYLTPESKFYGEEKGMSGDLRKISNSNSYINPNNLRLLDILIHNGFKFKKQEYIRYNPNAPEGLRKIYTSTEVDRQAMKDMAINMLSNTSSKISLNNLILSDKSTQINLILEFARRTGISLIGYGNTPLKPMLDILRNKSKDENSDWKSILKCYEDNNFFIIKSVTKRTSGDNLPNYRLVSLSNDFQEQLANIKNKLNEKNKNIENQLKQPISETFFYNNQNMYKGSRIMVDITNESLFKNASEFNEIEQIRTAIEYNYAESLKNGEIILESITPSDKSSIPQQVFDANFRINGKKFNDLDKKGIKRLNREWGIKANKAYLDQAISIIINSMPYSEGRILLSSALNNVSNVDVDTLIEHGIGEELTNDYIDLIGEINLVLGNYKNENLINGSIAIINNMHVKKTKTGFVLNPMLFNMFNKFAKGDIDDFFKDELNLFRTSLQSKNLSEVELNTDTDSFTYSIGNNKIDLDKYFYTHSFLSYHYLLASVGNVLTHKDGNTGNVKSDPESMGQLMENSFKTMTKRMVALTATMHTYSKDALYGLPNMTNWITIPDPSSPVVDINDSKGTSMDVYDGAMFAPMYTLWLSDNSTTDYKVNGFNRKMLTHYLDPVTGVAYLPKLACFGITNAWMRESSMSNFKLRKILETSLVGATLDDVDITKDFNGNSMPIIQYFNKKNENGIYSDYEVKILKKDKGNIYEVQVTEGETGITTEGKYEFKTLLDVFNFIGGEFSKSKNISSDGSLKLEYSEGSQELIFKLLNSVGKRKEGSSSVLSQKDVDQSLKNKIIHYFPTASTQKSAAAPIIDIANNELQNYLKRGSSVLKVDISNTGLQLDADHEADNAMLSEPTQLISFLSQMGLSKDNTERLYESLELLINSSEVLDQSIDSKSMLEEIFGLDLIKTFTEKELDVLGLAQSLCKGYAQQLKENPGMSISDLKIPYSDENILGKLNANIISYLNRYISRKYQGAQDVMVPSHDISMIFEDNEGNLYTSLDIRDSNGEIEDRLKIDEENQIPMRAESVAIGDIIYISDDYGNFYYLSENGDISIVEPGEFGSDSVVPKIEINTYNQYSALLSTNLTIKKSYTSPRNLKSRSIFVNIKINEEEGFRKVNLMSIGLRKELSLTESEEEKNKIRKLLNNTLLRKIGEKDVDFVNNNGGFILNNNGKAEALKIIEIGEIEVDSAEVITSFKNNSAFNIPFGTSLNEILSKKAEYFKEINKCGVSVYADNLGDIEIPDFTLKNKDGKHIMIYLNPIGLETESATPALDESGSYVIDNNGELLYPHKGLGFFIQNGITCISLSGTDLDKMVQFRGLIQSKIFSGYDNSIDNENEAIIPYVIAMENDGLREITQEFLNELAEKQYLSFKESLKYIIARIPSQSLQFASPSKIVAFFPSKYNVSLVSKYQTWEQGSDYDIDKNNNIGIAISKDGIIPSISPYFDYNNASKSYTMPMPNKDIVYGVNTFIQNSTEEVDSRFNDLYQIIKENNELIKNYLMDLVIFAGNKDLNVYESDLRTNLLVYEVLNDHNKYRMSLAQKKLAYSNIVSYSMQNFYADISTVGYATLPTTTDPIKAAARTARTYSKDNHNMMSIFNPITSIEMNVTTSVGKMGIAIGANAGRAQYAIEYFNSMFLKSNPNWVLSFNKLYNPYEENTEYNFISHDDLDVKGSENNVINFMKNIYPESNVGIAILDDGSARIMIDGKENIVINRNSVAVLNSSLISSATDNAKELDLNDMNATPETLPVFIWLMIHGVSLDSIVKIFASDSYMSQLIKISKGDFYKGISRNRILTILNNIKKDPSKSELYGINQDGIKYFNEKTDFLIKIFSGAEELTFLASALSVNKAMGSKFGESTVKRLRFEKSINNSINNYLNSGEIDTLPNVLERGGAVFLNELLQSMKSKRYILNGIEVGYFVGNSNIINFSKKLFVENSQYALDMIELYNYAKIDYNVLAIINKIPHFNAMTKKNLQSEIILRKLSYKSEVIFNLLSKASFKGMNVSLDEVSKLRYLINDKMILSSLINSGFEYLDDRNKKRTFDTLSGLKGYIGYVNTVLIPKLKEAYVGNYFLDNLVLDEIIDFSKSRPNKIKYFKPRQDITSPQNEDFYSGMLTSFNIIGNKKITYTHVDKDVNGNEYETYSESKFTIAEHLFMYNAIISKNRINRNSITKLFSEDIKQDGLISKYFEEIGSQYDESIGVQFDEYKSIMNRMFPSKESNGSEEEYDIIDSEEGGSTRPTIGEFPFEIDIPKTNNEILINSLSKTAPLIKAISVGKIIIKKC